MMRNSKRKYKVNPQDNHQIKHDQIVDYIDYRLKAKKNPDGSRYYMTVAKEMLYGIDPKTHNYKGEIDNFAIHHGTNNRTYVLFFEDKYRKTIKLEDKAHHQLDREDSYLEHIIKSSGINPDNVRVFKFFVHGCNKGNGIKIRRYNESHTSGSYK